MSDEIRDALRARTPMAAASSSEQDVSAAGDVAARSIQTVQMALEKKPEAPPLAKALWQAKDDLKKWEDQVLRLKKKGQIIWSSGLEPTVDRHPLASVGTLVLGLRCAWCPGSAPMPKLLGLSALPPAQGNVIAR
jgi:hypothetical protein